MNYSPMDALLASDSKPQFDLDATSPGALEGRSETHILRPNWSRPCQRRSARLRAGNRAVNR